jgi:uncharacterized alpha-E superfamily protein
MMLSRVADSLYWMGRYIERAENITRILLVTDDISTEALGLDESLAQAAWKDLLAIFPAAQLTRDTPPYAPLALPYLHSFFADGRNPYSVSYSLRRARENARAIREALTLEVFVVLNETFHDLEAWERKAPADAPGLRDALTATHRGVFSIVGAIAHTLPRDEGRAALPLGVRAAREAARAPRAGHRRRRAAPPRAVANVAALARLARALPSHVRRPARAGRRPAVPAVRRAVAALAAPWRRHGAPLHHGDRRRGRR